MTREVVLISGRPDMKFSPDTGYRTRPVLNICRIPDTGHVRSLNICRTPYTGHVRSLNVCRTPYTGHVRSLNICRTPCTGLLCVRCPAGLSGPRSPICLYLTIFLQFKQRIDKKWGFFQLFPLSGYFSFAGHRIPDMSGA